MIFLKRESPSFFVKHQNRQAVSRTIPSLKKFLFTSLRSFRVRIQSGSSPFRCQRHGYGVLPPLRWKVSLRYPVSNGDRFSSTSASTSSLFTPVTRRVWVCSLMWLNITEISMTHSELSWPPVLPPILVLLDVARSWTPPWWSQVRGWACA